MIVEAIHNHSMRLEKTFLHIVYRTNTMYTIPNSESVACILTFGGTGHMLPNFWSSRESS